MKNSQVNRLIEYIDKRKGDKFKYGKVDCVCFIFDCLTNVFEIELPKSYYGWTYGCWTSEKDKKRGCRILYRFMKKVLSEIPFTKTTLGDILLIDTDDDGKGDSLAIFLGNGKIAWACETKGIIVSKQSPFKDNVKAVFRIK